MIASETWWKAASAMANRALSIPVVLTPLLVVGCTGAPTPPDPTALIPPAPPVSPPASPASARGRSESPGVTAGFRPLASPQQVLNSVDLGRRDPFGRSITALPIPLGPDGKPLSAGAKASGRAGKAAALPLPPLQLPRDFSISGVIDSGGVSEAVVSYGDLSGSLRPGDRGGHTTDLLPPGWSVASIDVQRGVLTLRKGGRKISAEL